MTLIADTPSLAAFCERQRKADFIAVDTEFLRDNTYWPKLCLVQVGGPEEVAAIDTLAQIDLQPLIELLADERVLKVFHAGRQDLEIFFHMTGHLPHPIFDTQVAAMVCGFGDQVGYDTLARKLVGARIDKASRFADWSKRPLTERQLEYALADVIHLRPIYNKLARKLEKTGRAGWLDEEMAVLTHPATYRLEPDTAWKRLKTRSGNRRYLAVLRALAAWRETEAQRRDTPRNRVLRDEQLQDIAAHRPQNTKDLARTRGLSRDYAEGRAGQALVDIVNAAMSLPDSELPEAPKREDAPLGLGPLVELLKVLLKMKSEEHEVAHRLIASGSDLEAIAADDKADVPALRGWRREIFGEDALALKHGKLALTAEGTKVELVVLGAAGKATATG